MSQQSGPGTGDNGSASTNDDIRAGEFVLGLVERDEYRVLKARVLTDAQFARLVGAWERRMADWLPRFPRLTPPVSVWERVRVRLDWPDEKPLGWWDSARPWRWAAAVAIALAGVASFVAVSMRPPVVIVQAPPLPRGEEEVAKPVAVLTRQDGSVGWLASIDMVKGAVFMVPVPSPGASEGLADELWISQGSAAPRSLGFVSNQKAHTIVVPANLRAELASGAQLSISLEEKPGIPHSIQSERIVARGTLQGL